MSAIFTGIGKDREKTNMLNEAYEKKFGHENPIWYRENCENEKELHIVHAKIEKAIKENKPFPRLTEEEEQNLY